MGKKFKVKVFTGLDSDTLERKIAEWDSNSWKITIEKVESAVNDKGLIVITVFYFETED